MTKIREGEKKVQITVTTTDKESLVVTFFKVCVDLEITVDTNTQRYANPGKK